ncbi:MAG: zinc metallopeptidase [Clostridia bacterium]|nr:zinc metallopeptidase [Clostridia bacterium]
MLFLGYYICGGIVLVTILISLFAQVKVHSAYNKYQQEASPLDMTGVQLAHKLAQDHHMALTIRSTSGHLSDHFDPRDNSINISHDNVNSKSIAAHAIIAHEFGHALQHEENYMPYKVRQATVKIASFVSKLLIPMIILAILLEIFVLMGVGNIILYVYVGIYAVSFIVSLVTLPVEFNASKRAKKALAEMGVSGENANGVADVLNAAAMTYVAAMLVNFAYLLRILSLLRFFSRD